MLTKWETKYPIHFTDFPNILSLNSETQEQIHTLITTLEELNLLDEDIVEDVLKLPDSFDKQPIPIQHCVAFLSKYPNLSEDILPILNHAIDPISCINLISKSTQFNIDFSLIKPLLLKRSLSNALVLFEGSDFHYSTHNIRYLRTLVTVLSNPLSETIFQARLRVFGDYSEPEDFASDWATNLIETLYSTKKRESKYALFFDECAKIRPFPGTQKYISTITIDEYVHAELDSYCRHMIEHIETKAQYDNVRRIIQTLRDSGGSDNIFDEIKYRVGSAIESTDWYSLRSYQQLMNEIHDELIKPQIHLSSYESELSQVKYDEPSSRSGLRRLSILGNEAHSQETEDPAPKRVCR